MDVLVKQIDRNNPSYEFLAQALVIRLANSCRAQQTCNARMAFCARPWVRNLNPVLLNLKWIPDDIQVWYGRRVRLGPSTTNIVYI